MMMMTMMIDAMVLDGGRSTTGFADCVVRLRPIVFLLLLMMILVYFSWTGNMKVETGIRLS